MAERSRLTGEGRASALRRLVGQTGDLLARGAGLPSLLGRLVSRDVPAPDRARPVPLGWPGAGAATHRVVPGAALGRASVAASFEGGELRVLQYVAGRVVGWASIPLPEGLVRSGVVVDAPGLADALGESFSRLGLSRRRVIGGVSGLRVSASLLELPSTVRARDSDLAEIVADEASRTLGVSPDDSYLQWQRVPGRRRERLVYVVAVPREPLLLALEAFESAGIQVQALDLRPLALARAVNQRDAIIANLESDSLDVVVVADDLPVLIRSLGLPAGGGLREPAHDQLVAEVGRALATYEDTAPGQPLDPGAAVYLSGAEASGIALAERLRAQTGHPIGRPLPPLLYPSDFPLGEQLANVGLALKQL